MHFTLFKTMSGLSSGAARILCSSIRAPCQCLPLSLISAFSGKRSLHGFSPRVPRCNLDDKTASHQSAVICNRVCSERGIHSLSAPNTGINPYKLDFGICSSAPARKDVNEDAWILYDSDDSCTVGVADGVSSWRRNGVDVEVFSNQLACNISILAHNWSSEFQPSPMHLLSEAYEQMQRNREAEGSCTVSVGVIDKVNGILNSATLGDCGVRVIRDNKVIMQSKEQYVSLCIPYQLGILPQSCNASLGCQSFKQPSDADVKSLKLQPDDFIIFGSDGLFDNLWNDEILDILTPEDLINQRYDLDRAAEALVFYAHRRACGGLLDRPTPHAHKICGGCAECLEEVFGGNIDDVTACIAHLKV